MMRTEQSKAVFRNKLLFIIRAPIPYIVIRILHEVHVEPDMTSLLS